MKSKSNSSCKQQMIDAFLTKTARPPRIRRMRPQSKCSYKQQMIDGFVKKRPRLPNYVNPEIQVIRTACRKQGGSSDMRFYISTSVPSAAASVLPQAAPDALSPAVNVYGLPAAAPLKQPQSAPIMEKRSAVKKGYGIVSPADVRKGENICENLEFRYSKPSNIGVQVEAKLDFKPEALANVTLVKFKRSPRGHLVSTKNVHYGADFWKVLPDGIVDPATVLLKNQWTRGEIVFYRSDY